MRESADPFYDIEDEATLEPPSDLLEQLRCTGLVPPKITNREVNLALERLPSGMRSLLRMAYVQDVPTEDLAEHFGVEVSIIAGRLGAALSRLAAEVTANLERSFGRPEVQILLGTVGCTNAYVSELLILLIESQDRMIDAEEVLSRFGRRFPHKDRAYLLTKISHARVFLDEHFCGLLRVLRNHPNGRVHQVGVNRKQFADRLPAHCDDAMVRLAAHEERASVLIASGASVKNYIYRMRSNPTLVRFMGLLLLEEGKWVHRGRLYPAFAERSGREGIDATVHSAINHCRKILHENFPGLLEETFEEDSQLRIPVCLRIQPDRFDFYRQHGDRLAQQMLASVGVKAPSPELHRALALLISGNRRWIERDASLVNNELLECLMIWFPTLIQSRRNAQGVCTELRFHPDRFNAYFRQANLPPHPRPWADHQKITPPERRGPQY